MLTPTLPTSCGSLPPEGAAAPAVRQSRSRSPYLQFGIGDVVCSFWRLSNA